MRDTTWEIIPLVPLPARGRQAFTYRVPPDAALAQGMLVRIPLGSTTVRGVAWRPARARPPRTSLKSVQRILSREPLFTVESFSFLNDLANASLEPFSALVKAAAAVRHGLGPGAQHTAHRTGERHSGHPRIAWEPLDDALARILEGPTLVLVPELAIARRVVAILEQRGVSSAVFAQTLPAKQRRAVWQQFVDRAAVVLVTTHAGIFLPFQALTDIVVIEAALPSHRQWDLHPRYDAKAGALLLARRTGASLTLQSSLPSLDLAALEPRLATRPILHAARWELLPRSATTDPVLLPATLDRIHTAVRADGSALLFHDIVGTERTYVCDTCGAWLRCAVCGGTLERSNAKTPRSSTRSEVGWGSLRCRACGADGGTIPQFCPRCNSPHIGPRRVGTQRIEHDLTRALPGVPIVRLDRETVRRAPHPAPRPTPQGPRVVIGTERSFAVLGAPAFDLVAVLSADRLLEQPAFDAAERFLITLARLAQHGAPKAVLLLQTAHPHLSVVQALAQGDVANWRTEELADRALLRYPPSAALLHLERRFPTTHRAGMAARAVIARFKARDDAHRLLGHRIAGSGPSTRAEILLRGSLPQLQRALEHVPAGWSTDPHVPLSLL